MPTMSSVSATQFREEVETLLYAFMNTFDSSGKNSEQYHAMLDSLTPEEFVKWFKNRLDNPQWFPTVEITPFNKKMQPKFENYRKLAKLVGIELEEFVVLPYLSENTVNKTPILTLTKVPVGMLHLKRLQQIVRKKNKTTTSIEVRDQRKGQVVDVDKGGRMTDADMFALTTIGAFPVMKELYGPRADSIRAKEQFYQQIREGTRQPRLEDLTDDIADKVAINTLNNYIMGASLMSDLISDSYILEVTKRDMKKNKMNGDKM